MKNRFDELRTVFERTEKQFARLDNDILSCDFEILKMSMANLRGLVEQICGAYRDQEENLIDGAHIHVTARIQRLRNAGKNQEADLLAGLFDAAVIDVMEGFCAMHKDCGFDDTYKLAAEENLDHILAGK